MPIKTKSHPKSFKVNLLTLRKAEYESSSYNLTVVRPFANCLCVAAATLTYKKQSLFYLVILLFLT